MPGISCSLRMLQAQLPTSTTSAAQLWTTLASTQTIFTLSALTSFTLVSISDAVSFLNTTSDATQVHTCRHSRVSDWPCIDLGCAQGFHSSPAGCVSQARPAHARSLQDSLSFGQDDNTCKLWAVSAWESHMPAWCCRLPCALPLRIALQTPTTERAELMKQDLECEW